MQQDIIEVAIAVIRRGAQLLICQRKPDAVLANYWEFPGGKIEPGETPACAAEREVREELDIAVRAVECLPAILHHYDHAAVRLHPILCEYQSGTPQPIGCSAFKWILADQLSLHPFPPANTPLLRALADRFR